ncbi:Pycsar system effector family protein [Acidithiobacillus ferriphilus]|uniref:Pycsar system effector family protein n=1 Tax=Acidithiobacillus ferriphilus TaxID=1689834 RepID=UPI0040578774
MSEIERLDLLEKTLGRILVAIGAADAKVAQLFAISTGMLGFEATIIAEIHSFSCFTFLFLALSALPLLFSLFSLFMVLYPRLDGPESVIYFYKIARKDIDCYLKQVGGITNSELMDDYARQSHRNAEIASAKFAWLRKANMSLFFATIPWLIVVLIGYAAV